MIFELRKADSRSEPLTSTLINVICTLIVVLSKDFIHQFSMNALLALHLLQCLKAHQLKCISVNKQRLWRHQENQGDR